jgi:hypothetical protein
MKTNLNFHHQGFTMPLELEVAQNKIVYAYAFSDTFLNNCYSFCHFHVSCHFDFLLVIQIQSTTMITVTAVQRSSGPAVQRSSGPAVQRVSGPAVQRSSGPAVQRSSGPAVQWSSGPAVQRSSGPPIQRSSGPAVQRFSGHLAQKGITTGDRGRPPFTHLGGDFIVSLFPFHQKPLHMRHADGKFFLPIPI